MDAILCIGVAYENLCANRRAAAAAAKTVYYVYSVCATVCVWDNVCVCVRGWTVCHTGKSRADT
jgi:hypothetical protein